MPVMLAVIDFNLWEIFYWILHLSLHRFLTSKRSHFFNFLQEWHFRIISLTEENLKKRVKSSCTQQEIFLPAFRIRTWILLLLKEKAILKRTARTDFYMLSQKRQPLRKTWSLFLCCSNKSTPLAAMMRSPRREFRPARDARYQSHDFLVAYPRWCPRRCDERIMKMTMLSTYLSSTHTRWRVLLFWRFVRQFWGLTCALGFSRRPVPWSSVGKRLRQLRNGTSDWTIQRVRYTVKQSAFCLGLLEFWTWCDQKSAIIR